MSELTQSVVQLVNEFAKLPGIGKKSAERLAYHILRIHRNEAMALADAIRSVKDNVQYCRKCYNLAEGEECTICRDPSRQQDVLCVVEQPRDLMALEQSGVYRGLYHVLLGRIAPLDGIGPEQLTIDALVRRVREGGFKESDYGDQSNGGGGRHRVAYLQPVGGFADPYHPACPRNHYGQCVGVCQQGNPRRRHDGAAGVLEGI